ncbi:MAG: M36 family metallopeptidase, partial [Polyangiales bacterium]
HEYGHGLTWRMVGSMSGPISGAIGEGASDVVAFLLNGDDRIGEYAYGDPNGIRRAPYGAYTLTYAAVTGAEVHNDGEIYAAAMWRVYQNYLGAGLTSSSVLDDFVGGLDRTPAAPTFEAMRDGMVAEATASGGTTRGCLVWRGFASIGIGQGSSVTLNHRGQVSGVTTSSTVPAVCNP